MTTQFLMLAAGKIAYDDQGAGPLVVCVPGMGDSREQYRFLAQDLVAAGYRVVKMDLRGVGESSVVWQDYRVSAIGQDIIALVKHLDAGPAFICGNSMAAGAAVCAAADAPDLIAGLVLLGGFVRDTGPLWLTRLIYGVLLARPWGPALWKMYFQRLYPTRKPADFAAYVTRQNAMLAEPGRFRVLQQMMRASKLAAEQRLDQVKAPVLVVMGSKDIDFPKPEVEAQLVADRLRGQVFMVDGAGHYPHTEFPEVAGPKIVAFLNEAWKATARSGLAV